MSFKRASAFYMSACEILGDEDQGMTPGERAVAYASLAQVEAIIGLARLIAAPDAYDAARRSLREAAEDADDQMEPQAADLIRRITGDH